MPGISDVWLFSLFLFKSIGYAVAAGMVLGLLDAASHRWWNGSVTKQQYVWALGLCFILGLFVQWQDIQHQFPRDGQSLPEANQELRNSLQEKNHIIEDLKRERDLVSAEADSDLTEDLNIIIRTLKRQLDEKQREVSVLQQQLSGRTSK